jgi:F-type H+-transporting ATPase subunit alpha
MPIEQEVLMIYAGTKGYLDDVPLTRIDEFQTQFLSYVDSSAAALRTKLTEKKELTDEIENLLKQALTDFKAKAWKK